MDVTVLLALVLVVAGVGVGELPTVVEAGLHPGCTYMSVLASHCENIISEAANRDKHTLHIEFS